MRSILTDYLRFVRHDVRWWLAPFLVLLAILALAAWLEEAAPAFVYPLF